MEPSAQANGDVVNPDATQQNGEGTQAPSADGVQKRIDELVARDHQRNAEFEQMKQLNAELIGAFAATRTQQPVNQEPAIEYDPEVKRQIQSMLEPLQRQFAEVVGTLQGQLGQVRANSKFATMPNVTPQLADRAAEIYAGFVKTGLHKVATEEDAMRLAKGELYDKMVVNQKTQTNVNTQQANWNRGVNQLTGNGPAGITAPVESNALPAGHEKWSIDEYAEYYKQKAFGRR